MPIYILRCLALAVVTICLCVVPGANAKLPWSTHTLVMWLACGAFICWLAARLFEWKPLRPHEKAVWWIAILIGMIGWLVTCFPSAMVERATGTIFELDQNPWVAFGTVDEEISIQAMISISAALMVLLMTLDFASERTGRCVLAVGVTAAGFITAIAGLCLQTSADLTALWQVRHVPSSVFGLFWYHGNTAAFLNLSWPVGVWLCLLLLHYGLRTFRQQMVMAFLVVAVLMQVIAVFVNVSKMGHLILVLEMLLLAGAGLVVLKPRLAALPFSNKRILLFLLIGIGVLVGGAWLSGAGAGFARWNIFATRHFDDPARRHAALMAIQIGLDHGWLGIGPGTFEWVSPHYSISDPLLKEGRWRHAHNDYAEFFAEWGWSGAVIFGLLLILPGRRLFGAVARALSNERQNGMSFQRRTGLLCFSVALGSVLLHAMVDFPLQIDAIRPVFATVMGAVLAMTASSARTTSK